MKSERPLLFSSAILCAVLAASGCSDEGDEEGGGGGTEKSTACTLPELSNQEGVLEISGDLDFSSEDMDIVGSSYSSGTRRQTFTLEPSSDQNHPVLEIWGGAQDEHEGEALLLRVELEDETQYRGGKEEGEGATKLRYAKDDNEDLKGSFCGTLAGKDDPSKTISIEGSFCQSNSMLRGCD